MFHDIPELIAREMRRLEAIDARDRSDGTPRLVVPITNGELVCRKL